MIKYSTLLFSFVIVIAFSSCYKKAKVYSREVIDEKTLVNNWVTSILNKEILIRNDSSGLYVTRGKNGIQEGNKQRLDFGKNTFTLSDKLASIINLPNSGIWNALDKNYIKEICLGTSVNDSNCNKKLVVIGYYYDENLLQPKMLKLCRDIYLQDSIVRYELIMDPAEEK